MAGLVDPGGSPCQDRGRVKAPAAALRYDRESEPAVMLGEEAGTKSPGSRPGRIAGIARIQPGSETFFRTSPGCPGSPASVARSPSETIPTRSFARLMTSSRRICFSFISPAASRTSWSS